jgi:hypothetical protein
MVVSWPSAFAAATNSSMDCADEIADVTRSAEAVRESTFPVNLNMCLSVELTPIGACEAVTAVK